MQVCCVHPAMTAWPLMTVPSVQGVQAVHSLPLQNLRHLPHGTQRNAPTLLFSSPTTLQVLLRAGLAVTWTLLSIVATAACVQVGVSSAPHCALDSYLVGNSSEVNLARGNNVMQTCAHAISLSHTLSLSRTHTHARTCARARAHTHTRSLPCLSCRPTTMITVIAALTGATWPWDCHGA